jgi:hypothetical protein
MINLFSLHKNVEYKNKEMDYPTNLMNLSKNKIKDKSKKYKKI